MPYGTAKIDRTHNWYVVEWKNVGNDLRNEPRSFLTLEAAEKFCRERGLCIIHSY